MLVPYALQHPGTTVEQLVALFGGTAREIISDLDTLMMTGMPPFTPGDLVDVEIDEEGGVWISMADHFARPLRLTRAEALALYLRGTEALGAPGLPEAPALASALTKLQESLAEELAGVAGRMDAAGSTTPLGPLATLQLGAGQHERIAIDYYTQSRDEMTTRVIDPEHVFWDSIGWYVIAWDSLADAERTFRVDRIETATPTGEHFESRGLAGPGRNLLPEDGSFTVHLRLQPEARWVCDYFGASIIDEGAEVAGQAEIEIRTSQLAWVVKLLLRLGPSATVISPPELRGLVREEAARALVRYS